jgi:hypothetical protein
VTTLHVIQLDRIIPSVLSPDPSLECVREFVYLCKNLALSYLQTKVNRGKLDPKHFGIPLDDLALDCIAPLFERNDRGRFVELVSYYGKGNLPTFSGEELLGATRRLVFSKVNEELFRLYRENDPSLSNIIRNIKIALRFSRTVIPVMRNNEWWIQPISLIHAQDVLPVMPAELIEARLLSQLERRYDLRHILQLVSAILEEQDLYQKRYPLVGIALVIRSLMVRSLTLAESVESPGAEISPEEISRFIHTSIEKTRTAMKASYVGKGKVSEKTFEAYFDCVEEILDTEYVSDNGLDLSYFDVVRKRMSELSVEEYRCHHRAYLEYLVRLTRLNLLESIKGELQSS